MVDRADLVQIIICEQTFGSLRCGGTQHQHVLVSTRRPTGRQGHHQEMSSAGYQTDRKPWLRSL